MKRPVHPLTVVPSAISVSSVVLLLCGLQCAAAEPGPGLRLAIDLADRGDAGAAAVEFRRLALGAPAGDRGAYEWAAAREHARDSRTDLSERMLDRAEDSGAPRAPCLLLHAENAGAAGDTATAGYFWSGFRAAAEDDEARAFGARKLAAGHLAAGRTDEAAAALRASPRDEAAALAAVEAYRSVPRRSPRIGGLLGLVPGLGYAYSGEYANAGRSLLLNGLFIGLMVLAADDDNWGAFGLAGFFEITLYTGSVYGGVDAAHRWNRRHAVEAVRAVEGDAAWEVDYRELPVLRIHYGF